MLKKILFKGVKFITAPLKGVNYLMEKAVNSVTPQSIMVFIWSVLIVYNVFKVYGPTKDLLNIIFIVFISTIGILVASGLTILLYTYVIEFLYFITRIPASIYDKCSKKISKANITFNKEQAKNSINNPEQYKIEHFIKIDKNKPYCYLKYLD